MSIGFSELELALGISYSADSREAEIRQLFDNAGETSMSSKYFFAEFATVLNAASKREADALLDWGVSNGVLSVSGTVLSVSGNKYSLQPAREVSVSAEQRTAKIFGAIEALIANAKPAPKAPKAPRAEGEKRTRAPSGPIDAIAATVAEGLKAQGGNWTRADVCHRFPDVTASIWNGVIKRLVRDKVVEKQGDKATASYRVL